MVIYVEASYAGSLFSYLPSDTSGKFTFCYTGFFSRTPAIQVKSEDHALFLTTTLIQS